jgi:hypothetical protein
MTFLSERNDNKHDLRGEFNKNEELASKWRSGL